MKFSGIVGYCISEEGSGDRAGIWEDVVTKRKYFGDVLSASRRMEQGEGVLDDINVSNRISIVADAFAYEHFFQIKFIEWMGCKWKVTTVEVARPRLILQVGGVYNGPTD